MSAQLCKSFVVIVVFYKIKIKREYNDKNIVYVVYFLCLFLNGLCCFIIFFIEKPNHKPFIELPAIYKCRTARSIAVGLDRRIRLSKLRLASVTTTSQDV